MRIWFVLLAALVLLPWPRPASAQSVQSEGPMVTVTPTVGRPGQAIYLSGGYFTTHVGIHFFMACPDWFNRSRNAWPLAEIPAAQNLTGTFAALKTSVPQPDPPGHMACTLYAGVAADPFKVPLPFTILGKNDAHLARHIRVAVRVTPWSPTCDGREMAQVRSAPGATITGTVRTGRGKPHTWRTDLPWTGKKAVRLAGRGLCGQRVRIVLKARLGDLSGQKSLMLTLPRRITRLGSWVPHV